MLKKPYVIQPTDSLELFNILQSLLEHSSELKDLGVFWTQEALVKELEVGAGIASKSEQQIQCFVLYRELNKNLIEINLLATRSELLKQGLMESLMNELLKLCEGKEIWLEVHEKNHKALNLYKKLGFLVSGKRPQYYKDGGAAVLLSFKAHAPG